MASPETNTSKVVARLKREGWQGQPGGRHDVYKHPKRKGCRIVVPRHRTLSPGVAREIAKMAGWKD
jgi:predicted RNA binding protein YcfA (HicA-like mRNA interferase family)